MRVLVIALVLGACRPEKVVIPHERARRTDPEIQSVSDTAPTDSVVRARDGANVELAKLWADKPVVLVFYMGHWCPHCQKQLGDLNERQKEFTAQGATIAAISADSPDDAGSLHDRLQLGFELYSDSELAVIGKWGVADYGANIAKPATFIIQPGGAISFRKIGENQTDRPSVDDVLAHLRK